MLITASFLMLLTALFFLPYVQNASAQFIAQKVNESGKAKVELGRFQYVFPNRFVLRDLLLRDEMNDTLAFVADFGTSLTRFHKSFSRFRFGITEIKGLKLYLHTAEGDSLNGFEYFLKGLKSDKPSVSDKGPFGLRLGSVHIEQLRFKKWKDGCLNCMPFNWAQGELDVQDFHLRGDSIYAQLRHVALTDLDRIKLKHLEGFVHYSARSMALNNFMLITDSTHLEGEVDLKYDSIAQFADFANLVEMDVWFEESHIHPGDVGAYVKKVPELPAVDFKFHAKGFLNDLSVDFLEFKLKDRLNLALKGELRNILEGDLHYDLALDEAASSGTELNKLLALFGSSLPTEVVELGRMRLGGELKGGLEQFAYKGRAFTDKGQLDADIEIGLLPDSGVELLGKLRFEKLNLGAFVKIPELTYVKGDMEANVRFQNNEVEGRAKGKIDQLTYNNYPYRNIEINGSLFDKQFSGDFSIKDPNVVMDFKGVSDLRTDDGFYDFEVDLQRLDLNGLGLSKDSISVLSSKMDICVEGNVPKNWEGSIRLYENTYENPNNFYFFRDINISSRLSDTANDLQLQSDLANAHLFGKFELASLPVFFKQYFERYIGKADLDTAKVGDFEFSLDFNNVDVLTEILMPELAVEPGTRFSGKYEQAQDLLDISFNAFTLKYGDWQANKLNLRFGQLANRAGARLRIDHLEHSDFISDSLELVLLPKTDSLGFSIKALVRDSMDIKLDLKGHSVFDTLQHQHLITKSSTIQFDNHLLVLEPNGLIDLLPDKTRLKNIRFSEGESKLLADGDVSSKASDTLQIGVRDFDLTLLNAILKRVNTQITGVLNGDIVLSGALKQPGIETELIIDGFELNEAFLGRMELSSHSEQGDEWLNLKSRLLLGELKTLELSGKYNRLNTETSLKLEMERFRLSSLNPYLGGILEDLRGFADGQLRISGAVKAMSVNGYLALPGVAFTIPFLNTDYTLEGDPKIWINDETLEMESTTLRDTRFGSTGKVQMRIEHKRFSDLEIDLKIKANKLLCLNTTAKHSSYYYGIAYGTGDISLSGNTDLLKVQVNAKAEKGTVFTLPLGGPMEVGKAGFITFLSPSERNPLANLALEEKKETDLDLQFNLEVTPDALLQVIMDEQSGMMLSGRGRGNLQMGVDRNGELSMLGNVSIESGTYNFAFSGLVNKRFGLVQGGTVTFTGSPFDANMDLRALYKTRTSLGPILSEFQGVRADIELYLKLTESLMNPNIEFEIAAPNSPSDVQTKLSNYLADKDRLNKQAFGLLSMNSFIADGGISTNGPLGGTTTGTDLTYQLITDQLSNWLNSGTNFIDINVNYVGSADAGEVQDQLEVGVSKRLLNDRVTINGLFDLPVGASQNQEILVGDVELVYSITRDGRLRARIFNQSNDRLQSQISTPFTQGLGIFYRTELPNKRERRRIKEEFNIKP